MFRNLITDVYTVRKWDQVVGIMALALMILLYGQGSLDTVTHVLVDETGGMC